MEEIWVIVSKKYTVRRAYGWFEKEEDCIAKCEELRLLRALEPSEFDSYTPLNIIKNNGLGKN